VILESLRESLENAGSWWVRDEDISSADVTTRSGFAYGCIDSECSGDGNDGMVLVQDGRLSALIQGTGESLPK
jgi:hypothetical protein